MTLTAPDDSATAMDQSERTSPAASFQELVLRLMAFWGERGCLLTQAFDAEKGAGTYNPSTFLRAIGPEPWRAAYVEPSRRPTDGRYGDNPNRLYRHHQFQVILKPSPDNLQLLYLESLQAIGIHPEEHDIRFVEDNWESPTLGAWGLGWEVWVDGMEATQFTYFQQCGGLECRPVAGELTYGLERLAMYLQNVDDVYDLVYAPGVKYREVFHQDEVEYSKLSFEALDVPLYLELYERMEKETERLVGEGLPIPAYDHLLHAAHAFNALDAKSAISVTERQGYILRIRDLAKMTAEAYLASREALEFPLGRADEPTPDSNARAKLPEGVLALESGVVFIELGTEELPAAEVAPAAEGLRDGLIAGLDEARLAHGEPSVFCTPRRLAVRIPDVAGRQEDRVLEVSGPPVKAAFKQGKPTKAAVGFAKGQGVSVDDLVRRETPKGEYLYAVLDQPGRPAAELLPEIIERALRNLSFKRSMRWGSGTTAFSRPVVWLVAGFGSHPLPVRFAGVEAGSTSRGHRFMAPEPFEILDDPFDYEARLEARKVMVDAAARRAAIRAGAEAAAKRAGGQALEDEALIDELTQLVEWPVPLLGSFDERFLEVPKEVLISEMVEHQRYIPILAKEEQLRPAFVVIANTEVEDEALSLGGYRRVLTARFSDGAFFFREDQKTPLFDRVSKLATVRFHRALGSTLEKVERFARISLVLAQRLDGQLENPRLTLRTIQPETVELSKVASEAPSKGTQGFVRDLVRSAFLAKADLTTSMVFEFPELQGVMGSEYARRSGEKPEVADAVVDHYRPRGADDELPASELGALIGMADRLDTLVGIFSVGKGPSGAADPFGLRRAALAVSRVLRDRSWHISLRETITLAANGLGDKAKKPTEQVVDEVLHFIRARLKASLTGEGIPTDVAEAALSAGFDDIVDAAARAAALSTLRATPEFEPLAVTFKRVGNIMKGERAPAPSFGELSEPPEQVLYRANEDIAKRVKAACDARDFLAAFSHLAELRPAVDGFFDGVMVMAEDPDLRARRMGLLSMTQHIFEPLADFTKLS